MTQCPFGHWSFLGYGVLVIGHFHIIAFRDDCTINE
jgi:hypothetical protein